jgi:hypothetical protein
MAVPSLKFLTQWLLSLFREQGFANCERFKDPSIIKWFVEERRNDWIESGRPFALENILELVFGEPDLSIERQKVLPFALCWYNGNMCECEDFFRSPWLLYEKTAPDVPDTLAVAIREEYPGLPLRFMRIAVAFIFKHVPISVLNIIPVAREAIITFLMVCNRFDLPPEILHLILLNLKIDTYCQDTSSKVKFLDTGKDLRDAFRLSKKSYVGMIPNYHHQVNCIVSVFLRDRTFDEI